MSASRGPEERPAARAGAVNHIVSTVRIRPEGGVRSIEYLDDHSLSVMDELSSSVKVYQYDHCFGPSDSQESVFDYFSKIVEDLLSGYTVTTLAYGQTGSGKTYTMVGGEGNQGLSLRLIDRLFACLRDFSSSEVSVSLVEIYNEDVYDLLSKQRQRVDWSSGESGSSGTCGVTEKPVTNSDEAYFWFQFGTSHRSTASNNLNEHSSRSHSVLRLSVKAQGFDMTETEGRLYLVDLAGSERASRSLVEGSRLQETQNINRSLSALGDTIQSLDNRSPHVPYRNSKLTLYLRDGLQLQNKVYVLFTIRETEDFREESVCTLEFASRVKRVNLGNVRAQVKAKSLEIQNSALRGQVLKMKEENESLQSLLAQVRANASKEREKLLLDQSRLQARLDSAQQSFTSESAELRRTIGDQRQSLARSEEEIVRLRRVQEELQRSQQRVSQLEKRVHEQQVATTAAERSAESYREQLSRSKSQMDLLHRKLLSLEGANKRLSSMSTHGAPSTGGSGAGRRGGPPLASSPPPSSSSSSASQHRGWPPSSSTATQRRGGWPPSSSTPAQRRGWPPSAPSSSSSRRRGWGPSSPSSSSSYATPPSVDRWGRRTPTSLPSPRGASNAAPGAAAAPPSSRSRYSTGVRPGVAAVPGPISSAPQRDRMLSVPGGAKRVRTGDMGMERWLASRHPEAASSRRNVEPPPKSAEPAARSPFQLLNLKVRNVVSAPRIAAPSTSGASDRPTPISSAPTLSRGAERKLVVSSTGSPSRIPSVSGPSRGRRS